MRSPSQPNRVWETRTVLIKTARPHCLPIQKGKQPIYAQIPSHLLNVSNKSRFQIRPSARNPPPLKGRADSKGSPGRAN